MQALGDAAVTSGGADALDPRLFYNRLPRCVDCAPTPPLLDRVRASAHGIVLVPPITAGAAPLSSTSLPAPLATPPAPEPSQAPAAFGVAAAAVLMLAGLAAILMRLTRRHRHNHGTEAGKETQSDFFGLRPLSAGRRDGALVRALRTRSCRAVASVCAECSGTSSRHARLCHTGPSLLSVCALTVQDIRGEDASTSDSRLAIANQTCRSVWWA